MQAMETPDGHELVSKGRFSSTYTSPRGAGVIYVPRENIKGKQDEPVVNHCYFMT